MTNVAKHVVKNLKIKSPKKRLPDHTKEGSTSTRHISTSEKGKFKYDSNTAAPYV
jgi:hypothetical protein